MATVKFFTIREKFMSNTKAVLTRLSRNAWFGALPSKMRELMLRQSTPLRLQPGEMLFRQGDPPSGLYALVSGALKISSLREDGREAILAVLEEGIWFGEISLIDKLPRTHDATALGLVEVLQLPLPAFDALMQQALFARAIASMLAGRVRVLYGIVEDATLRSTRARIARRLLLLAHGDVAGTGQARARVPVSQEGLAMMLGMSRQTLSKELRLLASDGLIELGYGYIDVVSESGLQVLTGTA
jgi:CRP/FNR family cyclic AMP-dependent transcriptional regulator